LKGVAQYWVILAPSVSTFDFSWDDDDICLIEKNDWDFWFSWYFDEYDMMMREEEEDEELETRFSYWWYIIRYNGSMWSNGPHYDKKIKRLKLNKLIRFTVDHVLCWFTIYIWS